MNVHLVPATYELLTAAIAGDAELARVLGVAVSPGWMFSPEALPHLRAPYVAGGGTVRWGTFFFVVDEPRTVVGVGGFKGAPSGEGAVEIGYSVAPAYRGRGIATNAAGQIVADAFSDAAVLAVEATTLVGPNASTRVLQGVGLVRVSESVDPEEGPLWHWRRTRPPHV